MAGSAFCQADSSAAGSSRRLLAARARDALHQHARDHAGARGQQHARGQLLGLVEIGFERFGQRIARDRHHALVAGRAVGGFDGDHDLAFAGERAETRGIAPSIGGSCRAMPRTLKSCVHCATSRLTSPLPCNCSVSAPSNFSVAASSTTAPTASPSSCCTAGG